MKRSRFSNEQIIGILREQEAGAVTADVCRSDGISEATSHVGGGECQAEEAFGRGDAGYFGLERHPLKKMMTPGAKRDVVAHARGCYGLSDRRFNAPEIPLPWVATQVMISRSCVSMAKAMGTTSPFRHGISRPSDAQRWLEAAATTLPS